MSVKPLWTLDAQARDSVREEFEGYGLPEDTHLRRVQGLDCWSDSPSRFRGGPTLEVPHGQLVGGELGGFEQPFDHALNGEVVCNGH